MEIACFNCKNTWKLPSETMLIARLKYKLGTKEQTFVCPNCGAKTSLTDEEFRSNDIPQTVVPITGAQTAAGSSGPAHQDAKNTAREAPTNPVEGPDSNTWRSQDAVIRIRGAQARRDHSNWSEVLAEFNRGEQVTILDVWSDGTDTWAQLGPERWVNIEQNGEAVFALVDD